MYRFLREKGEHVLKKGMVSLFYRGAMSIGAFYLTDERLVFVGYMRTAITTAQELDVPLVHIEGIKAEKALFLLNNVLVITTIRGEEFKVFTTERDKWLKAIYTQLGKL